MKFRWKIAQFFEAWWWRNYLRGKSIPDYLEWKRQYWWAFLEKIELNVGPEANILDAGCGPAGIFILFPENKVTAVDPLLAIVRVELIDPFAGGVTVGPGLKPALA